MESLENSAGLVENSSQPQNHASVPAQPETLAGGNFNLRSQLFRKQAKTFLPFKQRKMPPRAEEWFGNLADVPIPTPADAEALGFLELDWGMRAVIRGACPMLHTICFKGRAQSVWDPMPEELLVGYLETIARIPNSFPDIVEEYLPGVFEPIRGERSPDSINSPGQPRWYPKPILIAACIFAERRILSDPRATNWSDDEDSDYEDSDDEDAYLRETWPGTTLYNWYANLDESDNESDSSYHGSIDLSTGLDGLFGSSVYSNSDSDTYSVSDSASTSYHSDSDLASDSASTCSDDPDCSPDSYEKSSNNLNNASASSDNSSEDYTIPSDDDTDSADDDTNGSDEWAMESINQAFVEAYHELLRRGLELPCL